MTEKKYYESDRVYWLDEDQKRIVNLILGKTEPKNQDERELASDIEEIKKKGYIVEIPFE